MYRNWVLPCIACICILLLVCGIYYLAKPFPEGFLTAIPLQRYTIPSIMGVTGRYVRLRPSILAGSDGYLAISQLEVIDENDINVALYKPAYATSFGGSPVDKKYGTNVAVGNIFEFQPGTSQGPNVAVDGERIPRWSLANIFETGNQNYCPQNTAVPDTEYWQVDLGKSILIKRIIYTGRGDPQQGLLIGTSDTLYQVSRLAGMRLEIYDATMNLIYSNTFPNTDTVQTMNITDTPYTVNPTADLSVTLQTVTVPNVAAYYAVSKPFTTFNDVNTANLALIKKINTLYAAVDQSKPFDISGVIFPTLVIPSSTAPIQFYTDIYTKAGCPPSIPTNACSPNSSAKPPPIPMVPAPVLTNSTLTCQIFGSASPQALQEFTQSQTYTQSIYLGSPPLVEYYIRLAYSPTGSSFSPYIRTAGSTNLCMPDVINVFNQSTKSFNTLVSAANQAWNAANCTTLLNPDALALIPFASRNFIVEWVYNRSVRYLGLAVERAVAANATDEATITSLNNTVPSLRAALQSTIDALKLKVERQNAAITALKAIKPTKIVIPTYGLDITSSTILNSIAQQFYTMMGGNYAMTYIYDVLPLGKTMIDIRFELTIHTDKSISQAPILALKEQYKKLLANSKSMTDDLLTQAETDYRTKLGKLEIDEIENTVEPIYGVVARLFYTLNSSGGSSPGNTTGITITGLIFDTNAVTSFIPELNGGLPVNLGPMEGNINYRPTIRFTQNVTETLNCKDPATIQRMISDYTNAVQLDNKILLAATPPIDTSKGNLFVSQVAGAEQVSPTQCALQWTETLYDAVTNMPVPSSGSNSGSGSVSQGVTRNALISYVADKENWNAFNVNFDPSGLKFYTTPSVPACIFSPLSYQASIFPKLSELGSSSSAFPALTSDFLTNSFKNGIGPVCPSVIPTYTFSPTDYIAANPSLTSVANPLNHYMTTGIQAGLAVKLATPITPLVPPITYSKPMPAQATLNTLSGQCPKTSCEDLDLLFSLVDQYNSAPMFPGSILRVKRAFTPNPYQCDVEVDINYDSQITNWLTDKPIKKGTVAYTVVPGVNGGKATTTESPVSVPMTGVQMTTLAFYVSVDKTNCNYILNDASGATSGTSIQPNTPSLYQPMEYAAQLSKRTIDSTGSHTANIQRTLSATSGSIKSVLTKYRLQTYAAVGDITHLANCPTTSCNNTTIMNSLMAFYRAQTGVPISTILNVGTLDSKTCDISFTTSTNQTLGARFTMTPGATPCTFTPTAYFPVLPSPSYTDLQAMGSTPPISAVAGFVNYVNPVSGFTDYSPTTVEAYPISKRGFGLDRARNSDAPIKDQQFVVPLEQEVLVPEPADETPVAAYKFLRFRPLKTRNPTNPSVHVSKFTFFLDGKAISLVKGKVSNPMGTWEGSITDVTGAGFKSGWSDDHKSPLLFAFPDAIAVNGYSLTTTIPENGLQGDPISWKLEGSLNSTYWTTLDVQTNFPTPVERFKEIAVISF